jgi:hypothetical protein
MEHLFYVKPKMKVISFAEKVSSRKQQDHQQHWDMFKNEEHVYEM